MATSSTKPASDSAAVGRAPEKEEFVSRKLIRPALRKAEGDGTATEMAPESARERVPRRSTERVKASPNAIEQTHAEDFYYQKQMAAKTLMTVALKSGEVVQGVVEWYDRNCIKLSRVGKPHLLLYKPGIRFMHKSDESR
jgi:host factor-I protein